MTGFDIALAALAAIWLGVLIGIIAHSKIRYGIFQEQRDLLIQVNRKGK